MKKLKIGFVGLGDHALQSHLALMLKYDNVDICGAFEPSADAFVRVKKEYGVSLKSFDSYSSLLNEADAVIICSPDRFHLQQLEEAAANGVHALCEKPLCSSEEELVRLQKVFENKDLVITSCHPRRYDYPYVQVKNKLAELVFRYGKVVGGGA